MVDVPNRSSVRPAVGDVLILRETRRRGMGDREVTVVRVGRKWGYVKETAWSETRFDLETGAIDGGGYSSPGRVMTHAQAAAADRRTEVERQLREVGIRFEFGVKLSEATLEKILAAVSS